MRKCRLVLWVLMLLVLVYGNAGYGTAYWTAQSGNITDAATWGGTAPSAMDETSDALVVASDYTVNVVGTTAMRVLYTGYYTSTWSESQGWVVMNDPDAVLSLNFLFMAHPGPCNGRFTQNAGTVNVHYGTSDGGLFMIKATEGTDSLSELPGQTAWGEYVLNGGTLTVDSQAYIADKGKATFTQTGGTFTVPWLAIGDGNYASLGDASDVAYYNMTGGVLNVSSEIEMGRKDYARGVFNLGDANSTGTIEGSGSLYIRMGNRDWSTAHADCIFQGWGVVGMTGNLMNAGKVIADSRSNAQVQADRDLDMSSFYFTSCEYYDRVVNAGWYAINRGRLLLPAVPVASGTRALKWGDDPAIPYPALVNSLVLNFTNVNGGSFVGSLLAKDRSDVGLANQKIIGVWDFASSSVDFGSGSVTLSFRYDSAQAASLSLAEGDLKLYSFTGGKWQEVAGATINTSTHFLTLANQTSLGTYAIGKIEAAKTPGDANGDGMVDVGDLGILAANYGLTSGATWALGDFNGDGAVDVGDLGILAANYGTGAKSGADFNADYAKVFGTSAANDVATDDTDSGNTLCSSLGLSLIAGLALMGLMIVKLEE